jgi:DNA-binding CsgD family transcriptional regulator
MARQAVIKSIAAEEEEKKARQKASEKRKRQLNSQIKMLEAKIRGYEDTNQALDVLLKKKAANTNELESNILTNIRLLIEPYLKKIQKTPLDEHQKVLLEILESNLNEIISPFSRKMSIREYNLTPMELQIANLIMQGLPSKKIGEMMKISSRTVDTHRKNIRKKVGLDKKRANLRSYLLTLH